jgi:geranylgeranyl pyrophosphate synthase
MEESSSKLIVDNKSSILLGVLPERATLATRLSAAREWLATTPEVDAAAYAKMTDGLFSAIFYTYIESSLDQFQDFEFLPVIRQSITTTPGRKFKSAIPFLLSDQGDSACRYAVVTEIAFALWTILDDTCDKLEKRYGVPTTHVTYGHSNTVVVLFGATESLRRCLTRQAGRDYADTIAASLLDCAHGELTRFTSNSDITRQAYLDNVTVRNGFIGSSWQAGLKALGKDIEAAFIAELLYESSQVSQMFNDYYDLVRGPVKLRDFRDGVTSYYLVRLREIVGQGGRLDELLAGDKNEAAVEEYLALLQEHNIIELVKDDACRGRARLLKQVANSLLSEPQKVILTAWIEMSLADVPSDDAKGVDFKEKTAQLVDAVDVLLS